MTTFRDYIDRVPGKIQFTFTVSWD